MSNPDKVFFPEPGLTKGDLVAYYLDVAECALPHLRRRPFHMKRFPDGVDGEFFHQKRVPAKHPGYVDEVPVSFPSGHSTVFAISTMPRRSRGSRTSAASSCTPGPRGCRRSRAGLPADRPRPDLGRPVAVRARDRARRARGDGRARARVVPEDLRRDRAAHPGTDSPELPFPRGAAVRKGARRGGRAAHRRPERRDDDLAARRPRRGVRRLRPERARPDDRHATRCARRPTRGLAPLRWTRLPASRPRRSPGDDGARIEKAGDPMRGMWRRPYRSGRARDAASSRLRSRLSRRH